MIAFSSMRRAGTALAFGAALAATTATATETTAVTVNGVTYDVTITNTTYNASPGLFNADSMPWWGEFNSR